MIDGQREPGPVTREVMAINPPPPDASCEQEAGPGFNWGYDRGFAQGRDAATSVAQRADEKLRRIVAQRDKEKSRAEQLAQQRDELRRELERARRLVGLLTVRQVVEADDEAIRAARLSPYCINESRATGDERIDPWWIEAALAAAHPDRGETP